MTFFEVNKNRHGANLVVFGRLRVRGAWPGKDGARGARMIAEKLNANGEALQLARLIEPILADEPRLWRLAAGAIVGEKSGDAGDPERAAARLWEIAKDGAP